MRFYLVALAALVSVNAATADVGTASPNLKEIFSRTIRVERATDVTEIPLKLRSGKIYLEASVGAFTGDFIFDTGSPTILDRSLAEQLELEVIGENTGQDANGNSVSMTIAIARSISIGDVTFYDVPVMVHDFASLPLGRCFIPNGVIGSELLPGSAWRLDTRAATLKIASSSEQLPALADTRSAPLNLFGYPHAPIVDYGIGRFKDKALFDTGNTAQVALFTQIMNDKSVAKRIDANTLEQGQGRLGTSAGGIGDRVPLKRFQLKTLRIGDYDLGRTAVEARPIPPTLIGAGILATHTVTLDYPNAKFLMAPHPNANQPKKGTGYALAVNGGHVEVMQVFEASAAHAVGVALGDKVIAIDGAPLAVSTADQHCEVSQWLANEFDAESVEQLTVERNGERVTLTLSGS